MGIVIFSIKFIKKEKKMIKPDNVFELGIPLNSYIYFYVKNYLVGSNATTTFTMGFESSALKSISKSLVSNNSYVEKYYPSISKIFNEMGGKQLSIIDLETYNKIINIFSKIHHLTGFILSPTAIYYMFYHYNLIVMGWSVTSYSFPSSKQRFF